jgi:amino acid permease
VAVETRQVQLPKPLNPKVLMISFGGLIVLTMLIAGIATQVAPQSIDAMGLYASYAAGPVVLLFFLIWFVATRRERTVHLYRCESCGRRWSSLGVDAYTPEDRQTAMSTRKLLRGFLWAFVGLIGLIVILALFFEFSAPA